MQPGNAWFDDCTTWDYEDPTGFFQHPLFEGDAAIDADNVAGLFTVTPPTPTESLRVDVVARQGEFGRTRSISAEIRPESISEFAFLVEESLRFGSGAVITGKIYVGDDLDFRPTPIQGIVHRDVFAEDAIGLRPGYGLPVFDSGSVGYDSRGVYLDIDAVYPEPLDFTNFWDDLALIKDVSCSGAGLCLSRTLNPSLGLASDPTAWLIEPQVAGGVGRLRVSAAYSNSSSGCVSSEEWWWLNYDTAAWNLVGTFDIPASGAVWADNHVVMGMLGAAGTVKGAVTINAGTLGSPKNIIIGSDLLLAGGTTGTDVLGLIATDEVWVGPPSVGGDLELNIFAAILTQGGSFQVARDCGGSGNVVLPTSGGTPLSELSTMGAMAIKHTGDVSAHFSPRNYQFDPRLETLRPPLFPLLGDGWEYVNWQENSLPCWALPAGCP